MAKAVDVARYILEQRDARGRLTSVRFVRVRLPVVASVLSRLPRP